MTGYTVHTGSTEKFTEGWDNIFGGSTSAKKKVKSSAKPTAKTKSSSKSGAKSKKAAKKTAGRKKNKA